MAQGHKHTGCEGVGGGEGFRCPDPPSHRPLCLLPPTPREVLGLVDLVALENGELGPLLSPGTLRGLEDECVTDVKVPGTREPEALCREGGVAWGGARGGLSSPLFTTSISLFPLWISEFCPKDTEV